MVHRAIRSSVLVLTFLAASACLGVDEEGNPIEAAESEGEHPAGHDHAHGSGTQVTPLSALGPYINNAKIPAAKPGYSTLRVSNTTEQVGEGDGSGSFRTVCTYSHMNYDDAIVFPGQPGMAHLHTYLGNTLANAHSTAKSLATTGNSTCRGGIGNRSAYWVPALIDAAGVPQAPLEAHIYYKTGYAIAPDKIKAFPQGLRVIAGDAKASGPQSHTYWGCWDNYIGHPSSIPNCGDGNRIVMIIDLPQCWDGKNLDSTDHKSHMAYPQGRNCPSTHPVAIPEISFNVLYRQKGSVSGWRLSSDMYDTSKPGGYSAHGDWVAGWDQKFVDSFVKNCLNPAKECRSHLLGNGQQIY
jgi:hypothetical protein